MDVLSFGLAALVGTVILIALMDALSSRLSIPFSVLAAVVGMASGLTCLLSGWSPLDLALDDYDAWFFSSLALTPQSVIYVFLPALLFEMTLSVDIRNLRQDMGVVAVMAVVAVVAATVAVGSLLFLVAGLPLVASLLLGAVVSTTDPAAVVSTFRRVGAPRRLLVLLEGESLLNDAAAIALFALLIEIIRHSGSLAPVEALAGFFYLFVLGAFTGVAIAVPGTWILRYLRNNVLAQTSITVGAAYVSFLTAELLLQASGIVAVVFAGLAWSAAGTSRVSNSEWTSMASIWAQLGYWSNGLIVLIAAWLVPILLADLHLADVPLILIVAIGAFGARALILFGLLPLLEHVGISAVITHRQKLLVWWGGIRGAVTLLLALSLAGSALPEELGRKLGAIGCGFVFLTLVVNAGSLAFFTRWLGLDRLTDSDQALRGELIAGTMQAALGHVDDLAAAHDLPPDAVRKVRADYEGRYAEFRTALPNVETSFGDRLKVGLIILANQERRIARRHYDNAIIGRVTMQALQRAAEDLADSAILAGRQGYQDRAAACLGFGHRFRLAMAMHRYLRVDMLLSRLLARRFHLIFEWEIVLSDLKNFVDTRLESLVGADAARNINELLEARLVHVKQAHQAMELQYPNYSKQLRQAFVERAALRWEIIRYDRFLHEAVIGPELHRSLLEDVQRRIDRTLSPPKLDSGFDRYALIDAVTLFQDLSREERRRVAKLTRTLLAMPGEVVARRGERGNTMYLIASGALEMQDGSEKTLMGSGEFFGELAILHPTRRRKTDVVALGFCQLLVLHRRDVKRLLDRHPELALTLKSAAAKSKIDDVRLAA